MGCVEFDRVMEGGPHTRGTRATRDARTLPPVVSSPLLRCLSPSTFFSHFPATSVLLKSFPLKK